ncbi:MAG: BON domain-containing protein [bacterium]|jgi:hyperosmotically inducible protein|nr:BON domain-containing protein [Bacillota bacterium]HHW56039.1 BON domain-containing protein [Bacillota bacterium]
MGDRQKVPSADAIKAVLARHMRLTALDIKVETRGGTVFLRGVVELLAEKLHAEEVVKYLKGVQRVENELTVAPDETVSEKHLEEEIRGLFRQETRLAGVSVSVQQGVVYLEGKVESPADEDLARHLAARVRGVKDVVSRLETAAEDTIDDADIIEGVEAVLSRTDDVDTGAISVRLKRGVVYLTGWVENSRVKEQLTRLVSSVEGVRRVINNLLVEEEQNEADIYLTNIIQQAIAQGLDLDSSRVWAFVVDGWAHLGGEVDTIDEREAVEMLVDQISDHFGGLEGMSNDIVVKVH